MHKKSRTVPIMGEFMGVVVVLLFLAIAVGGGVLIYYLIVKKPATSTPAAKTTTPPAPTWTELRAFGHNGDDIGGKHTNVTLEEAKSKCIAEPKCNSVFFHDVNSSGKGSAWLKTALAGPYQPYPNDATYILKRL